MEEDVKILEKCNPSKQESLQSENIADPMDAEQTWPTEEELAEATGRHSYMTRKENYRWSKCNLSVCYTRSVQMSSNKAMGLGHSQLQYNLLTNMRCQPHIRVN